MASPSLATATANLASPLTLDASPSASRPAAAALRKRPLLLLDHRPHLATPTPPLDSSAAPNHVSHAAAAAAPLSQARRKKAHSSGRPRWQTALSIAAKNAALLAALLYLGDLAWLWAHPAPPPPPDQSALAGYTARVADVEASLARAFRMLQVQFEAVDRKIDGEVGTARGELTALLEEKRLALEGQLRRLDARTDELNDALRGLKRMEFLRKDEFEKFWDEVKESLGSGSGPGIDVDLDQVRTLAREIAMREIEKHAADGIGRVDYAVASAGGRVVRYSEAYDAGKRGILSAFLGGDYGDPQEMLQPSFGEPGRCFALQGSSGFLEIKLRKGIVPDAITLEHVSKDVAYDMSTAPKDCRVSGWYQETPSEANSSHAAKMSALTEFTYDLSKNNGQTFDITAPDVGVINMVRLDFTSNHGSSALMSALTEFTYDLGKNNVQTFDITAPDVGVINMVRLDFTSNHGSSALTCIYRIRVHGHEPVSPGVIQGIMGCRIL